MIEIKNLKKVYSTREGDVVALDDINLSIKRGEVFGILGESGAGKSTLVRCINLLERPTEGKVIIDGVDVTSYTGRDLRKLRTKIDMIFQNFSLFQQRTVLQNVTFPLELQGVDRTERIERAKNLIELVGLSGKESRYPSELSGGQQQRVAIARALINRPEVMLCDEATSALDSRTTIQYPRPAQRHQQAYGRHARRHHACAVRRRRDLRPRRDDRRRSHRRAGHDA